MLGARRSRDGRVSSATYPDALGRVWSALRCRTSGELLLSAAPGYEFLDWGGAHHVGGGSHGSLHANDSLGALLWCGTGPAGRRARAVVAARRDADDLRPLRRRRTERAAPARRRLLAGAGRGPRWRRRAGRSADAPATTRARARARSSSPSRYDRPPPGPRAERAAEVAARSPRRVPRGPRGARAAHPRAYARAYLDGAGRWQVVVRTPPRRRARREEIAQVLVDDRDRRVLEAWTGRPGRVDDGARLRGRVRARGNAPWVWIGAAARCSCCRSLRPPLAAAAPRPARAARVLGLLRVLQRGEDRASSVPLAYPLLVYLLVRLLWSPRRRPRARPPPLLLVGPRLPADRRSCSCSASGSRSTSSTAT